MLNKNFQGWLNENNKKDLIDNFIKSLDDLNETKLVKIDTENLEEGRPLLYFEFIHQIKSFKNLIYFRLYDLGSSLLPLIEKKNYTSSVLICRSLFETILIFMFRILRVSERIENKKWKTLYIEIQNFKFVPTWKDDGDIDWDKVFPHIKRFHINDAIRLFSKVLDSKKAKNVEKSLFNHYSRMSEIVHPNQANRSLYINTRDNLDLETGVNKKRRDNFSVNHADDTVFPIFIHIIELVLIFDKSAGGIVDECLTSLEKYKQDLLNYQDNDFSKDIRDINPIIMEKMDQLKKKNLNTAELVNQLVAASFKDSN